MMDQLLMQQANEKTRGLFTIRLLRAEAAEDFLWFMLVSVVGLVSTSTYSRRCRRISVPTGSFARVCLPNIVRRLTAPQ
jgi:hypothetical protein